MFDLRADNFAVTEGATEEGEAAATTLTETGASFCHVWCEGHPRAQAYAIRVGKHASPPVSVAGLLGRGKCRDVRCRVVLVLLGQDII